MTLDIGIQSNHCHRVIAQREHRVTPTIFLSHRSTSEKSFITTNSTNRYYCSHLSRTLLILDLFIIHARTGTCHNQLDELTNVSIDIVVPSWVALSPRTTLSSHDDIAAKRSIQHIRECISLWVVIELAWLYELCRVARRWNSNQYHSTPNCDCSTWFRWNIDNFPH